jgi:hypothetical protein
VREKYNKRGNFKNLFGGHSDDKDKKTRIYRIAFSKEMASTERGQDKSRTASSFSDKDHGSAT